MISPKISITVLLLLLGTWFVTQSSSSVNGIPITQTLSSFPKTIGQYKFVRASESSEDIIKMLGVDDELSYTYQGPDGNLVTLYVGFYSAVGVTGSYHSPKNCLPGGGWGINSIQLFPLATGIEGNETSEVSEMIIRNGKQYQIVLYWFQNRGRIIASEYWEKIYLVLDALRISRRDGSFVRIMMTAQENELVPASNAAGDFAELVMKELESYLPGSNI